MIASLLRLVSAAIAEILRGLRDALAYVLATVLIGWIVTPPEWLP